MDNSFKQKIKDICKVSGIPATTLQKWANAENRSTHRELLLLALEAIEKNRNYEQLLENPPEATAVSLGFESPLNIEIDGISNRTWRSWFDVKEKEKQVNTLLLGLYWKVISDCAKQSGYITPAKLVSKLTVIGVKLNEVIKLYRASSYALFKLLSEIK